MYWGIYDPTHPSSTSSQTIFRNYQQQVQTLARIISRFFNFVNINQDIHTIILYICNLISIDSHTILIHLHQTLRPSAENFDLNRSRPALVSKMGSDSSPSLHAIVEGLSVGTILSPANNTPKAATKTAVTLDMQPFAPPAGRASSPTRSAAHNERKRAREDTESPEDDESPLQGRKRVREDTESPEDDESPLQEESRLQVHKRLEAGLAAAKLEREKARKEAQASGEEDSDRQRRVRNIPLEKLVLEKCEAHWDLQNVTRTLLNTARQKKELEKRNEELDQKLAAMKAELGEDYLC